MDYYTKHEIEQFMKGEWNSTKNYLCLKNRYEVKIRGNYKCSSWYTLKIAIEECHNSTRIA